MGIIRSKTDEEKKEMRDLGKNDVKRMFMGKLADESHKFSYKHEPYCSKCAVEEFQMEVETRKKELKRLYGYEVQDSHPELIKLVDTFNFKKYGGENYFKLVGEVERLEKQRMKNGNTEEMWVVEKNFTCQFNHGCTISVPKTEYEAMRKPKKGYDKDKTNN